MSDFEKNIHDALQLTAWWVMDEERPLIAKCALKLCEAEGFEAFVRWLRGLARESVGIAAGTQNDGMRAVNAGKAEAWLDLAERLESVRSMVRRAGSAEGLE